MNDDAALPMREHVRIVYTIFLAATGLSFGYCIVLQQFNGDFFPLPTYLAAGQLVAVLVACLSPYIVAWQLAGAISRIPARWAFDLPFRPLLILMLGGFACHIAATLLFGVGVMDSEVYSAPAAIMPFIQVLNRLDPFYLGAFFILSTPKRPSMDLFTIVLMVMTGFLRAGLGAFAYVVIALCTKYRGEILQFFRRAPWLALLGSTALPMTISALYEVRGRLRGDMVFDLTVSEMLLGRFVGRLSSFSNVAFIEQNSQSFVWASKSLEPLYYAKQGLVSLLGSGIAPTMTPERLLIAGTQSYQGFSTFMAGVPGNLIMAWNVSPGTALFNLVIMLACVSSILWLSRYFANPKARAFGLGMLFYPLTSGVANEFTTLLLNTLFFVAFAAIFSRRVEAGAQTHAA